MNTGNKIDDPYEGQKFKSFDALKKYLEEYGQQNYVKFWIRSSHTRNSLKSRISKTMNPDLKYVCVKFACIFGGEKIRCRGSGIRKSSTFRDLGCPCMINAVVGEDGNHVRLDTVILEHNHVLCKTLYDSLKKTKRKNQTVENNKKFSLNTSLVNDCIKLETDNLDYLVLDNDIVDEKIDASDANNVENNKLIEESESPQTCLEKAKDKYGKNIKILIVNSENTNNEFEELLKFRKKKDITPVHYNKEGKEICRLCLSSKGKLSPIFNPDLPLKSTVLSFKIMGCASIEVSSDDGLPNNICNICEAELDVAYKFRLKCENSDLILRKSCKNTDIFNSTDIFVQSDKDKAFDDEPYKKENELFESSFFNCLEGEEQNEIKTNERTDIVNQESLYVQFTITCPVCCSEHDTYESMLEHLEAHPDNETLLLSCNICNIICPTMRELQQHMRDHLNEIKTDIYSCPTCEMTFPTPEELKTHEICHTAVETLEKKQSQSDMNYLCNVCGKILKTKDRFRSHKNTHDGLRPHVCLKCGRGFADRKNMHHHFNVVHLRKPKLECPVCQKKFYTRTKMKSHVTMHYGVKPFACDICNKTFRLKMNMIKHKKTHSNDRPHKCDKCNAAFIDKNMLKRHSYIHGGIRPYPCPVCGHRFSVNFHLKKHLEKSKCSAKAVVLSEEYKWLGMTQTETSLPENECMVVYKANGDNILQEDTETITMDILQEYHENPNS